MCEEKIQDSCEHKIYELIGKMRAAHRKSDIDDIAKEAHTLLHDMKGDNLLSDELFRNYSSEIDLVSEESFIGLGYSE